MSDDEFEILNVDNNALEFSEDKTLNILIIGETGVGKSTFVNAFANYLRFDDLDQVEKDNPLVLIPCRFTVTDENYELRVVEIGKHKNEHNLLGSSSTQDPVTYVFPVSNGEKWIRLIDTPGIGDTRGIDQDTINCKKIVQYLAQFNVIHGILFLLKPNSSKITVLFEFCLKQIMSRLEKTASNNILFVFTNTRGTCYRPGETLPCLRKVLEDISTRSPYVKIPLSKENIFCLDNEAFRYLAAVSNGILFTDREKQYFAESWEKSAEESWRMIIHISGDQNKTPLEPHQVAYTMCINDARDIINQLKQPLADIAQLIQDKLRALENHRKHLELDNLTVKDLHKNLFIPIIDIEVQKLSEPVTVCTSLKCANVYKVRDVEKWHYIQKCHNPCYLKNVPKEMVGAPELVYCAAMQGTENCTQCSCHFSAHMHIYYESTTVDKTIENDHVKETITTQEEVIKKKEAVIKKMNQMMDELENERKIIINYVAQFAAFLQQNAITAYNDVYKEYIEYLIDREKSNGDAADKKTILHLQQCKQEYEEAKKIFDDALNMRSQGAVVPQLTAEAIKNSVDTLFQLKHTGDNIKKLYNSQNDSRTYEMKKMNDLVVNYGTEKKGFFSKMKNYFKDSTSDSEEDNQITSKLFNSKRFKFNKKSKNKKSNFKNQLMEAEKVEEAAVALEKCLVEKKK